MFLTFHKQQITITIHAATRSIFHQPLIITTFAAINYEDKNA